MPIELVDVYHRYDTVQVLGGIDLIIADDKVTTILGPSGCGKTTLLNIISGSIDQTAGSVTGRNYSRMSYLFQEPRLLPWRTVRENLLFVLSGAMPSAEIDSVIDHALATVGLDAFQHSYPRELSGGMRQRVAMARAFAYPGDLLLMDEPFQALDLKIRTTLANYFSRSWIDEPRTTVYVTHDIQEALLIGDVIHVLSDPPSRIKLSIEIHRPRLQRSLADEEIIKAEIQLYELLG